MARGFSRHPVAWVIWGGGGGEPALLPLPIPWIGGPYTLEALLFGASAGVQIASLLQVMVVFGEVIQPSDLLRRMPPGLHPAGVAASIGLTFAPQVRRAFASIRQASELRGRRPGGWGGGPSVRPPLGG